MRTMKKTRERMSEYKTGGGHYDVMRGRAWYAWIRCGERWM